MNLDKKDLYEMMAKGRKISGWSKPTPPEDSKELKMLERILKALEFQATRPDPPAVKIPEPKAPVVNVAPTPVTVEVPKPITKWKFTLTKNKAGHTTEIIATAIE